MAFYSKWMLILSFLNVTVLTTQRNIQAEYKNIHHRMNVDDLQAVFHVERHSDVPEYEVIHLHSIHKRETSSNTTDDRRRRSIATEKVLKLKAFGKKHELALQPLDQQLFKGNLKMWSAESDGNGSISYTELPDTYVGDPYQDEKNQAALLLHKDSVDGSLLMEGTIGHDLVIKPLPLHLRKYLSKKKLESFQNGDLEGSSSDGDEMFLDREATRGQDQISTNGFPLDSQNEGSISHPHHVVFRRQSSDNSDLRFSDFAYMEAGDFNSNKIHVDRKRRKRSIVKREAPYIIYPEILVIVDYDGYRLHGGDNVQVKRYFVSFWNGVDLRYKLLKGPKVRISIAGLIISRGRDATPYLERNRVGRDAVDSAAALTDMGKYLFRERRLPVYDIAVAVTKLDMCRRHYQNDACNRGTAGFAYVGGACVVNKRLEKVNSVAIIEDTGGFSGIIVAAHEVGHLLGAVHDGSPPPTYLGGPGAEKCRWEDGFIMSDLRHSEKGFKWSPCSVSSFHHFLNGDTATCLYNSPHEDESLPRVLPGKLLSLDAQCRRDRGTSACFKDERVCSQLFCFDSGSGYCVAYRPAAEGSPCGDGQTCSNGICIAEHENIIPDYSQNTPAYLRRQDDIFGRAFYGNVTKKSEWEEFWRTATNPTTPSVFNNDYNQNSQQYDPYNPYKNVFDYYKPSTINTPQTTKNPYADINKNWFYKVASKSDAFVSKKPAKNVFQDFNNLYYGKTTPQNDLYSYLKNDQVGNDNCVDTSEEIPGAISCYDYLTKYGLAYCADEYIKKNCCAAIKYLCNNQPL